LQSDGRAPRAVGIGERRETARLALVAVAHDEVERGAPGEAVLLDLGLGDVHLRAAGDDAVVAFQCAIGPGVQVVGAGRSRHEAAAEAGEARGRKRGDFLVLRAREVERLCAAISEATTLS
jgi:hypothetical protein